MSTHSDKPPQSKLPPGAAKLMIAILVAMALLSIYANVQRARRDKIETVVITPASPAPSASVASP